VLKSRRIVLGLLIIALAIFGAWRTYIGLFATTVSLSGLYPVWPGSERTHFLEPRVVFVYGNRANSPLSYDFISGSWIGYPERDGAVQVVCDFYGVSSGSAVSKPIAYVTPNLGQRIKAKNSDCTNDWVAAAQRLKTTNN
jgi:hypothetical protein